MVRHDGSYYLFYSGNVYDARYRTGVARAAAPLGPFQKHGAPILGSSAAWVGPGHGSVVHVGANDYFVYHAWLPSQAGGRMPLLDRIHWQGGWPLVNDGTPSDSPQPWPQ